MKYSLCLLSVCAFVLTTGCTRRSDEPLHPYSFQRQPAIEQVRRVVCLPMSRDRTIGHSADALESTVAAALRELTQFVVIEAKESDTPSGLVQAVLTNRVTADELLALRDKYQVDAVLVGHVHSFRGYDPILLSMTMHMVSCHDGTALWSASGTYDGNRETVQKDVAAWYRHQMADSGNTVQTWRVVLHTPSLYIRFVADRMFWSMRPPKE